MCTLGILSSITKHLTCYDSKEVLNQENIWMRDCKLTKLSCSTRWLGNESKHAELLSSKAHWYLPEFIYRKCKNRLHGMVSRSVFYLDAYYLRLALLCRKYCVTQICRAQQFLQWSNQLLSELFKGWD